MNGLIARRAWSSASKALGVSFERLATGKRINRAADDPAGSAAVDEMRARLKSTRAMLASGERETAYLNFKEGASSVVSDLLVDLQAGVGAAANRAGTTEDEREALQSNVDSILDTIDFLQTTQRWMNQEVLGGIDSLSLGKWSEWDTTIADGESTRTSTSYSLHDLRRGGRLNLIDGDAERAAQAAKSAVGEVVGIRAGIGTRLKDLESQHRSLMTEIEGLEAARSLIEDTDFGFETANLVRARVQQDAAAAMAQFANDMHAQTTMTLLQGVSVN